MSQEPINRIRERGYRVTPQRQLVLTAVRESDGHVTAGEVTQRVRSAVPAINQATVYRTLDFLCSMRLVTRTEISGQSVYEYVADQPHHHLVCRGCGHEEELGDHHFSSLSDHLLAEHGFQAELDHLAISGLCAGCRGAQ